MKTHIDRLRSVWKKNGILFLKAIVLLLFLFKILSTFIYTDNPSDWWLSFSDISSFLVLLAIAFGDFPQIWNVIIFVVEIIALIMAVASLILVPFKKKKVFLVGIISIIVLNVSDVICSLLVCFGGLFFAGIVNLLFSALIILISVCLLRRISQRAKKAEGQSEKQEDAPEETVCLNEA